MFTPTGFGLDIFLNRYAAHPDESWHEACKRVAWHVANAESGADRVRWSDNFTTMLTNGLFMPGGRIWYGAGKARGQLLNCFVIGTEDSREGWGQTVSDMIVISGTGGGVGLNCTSIRPRNSPIKGSGGSATGAVSLMEIINAAGEVIKAGGGRRTALMLCLSLSHGDIQEFLDKKLDLKELKNANVSIVFDTDPQEFFGRVKDGGEWILTHRGKEVGRGNARAIWEKVVANALKGGEPGILNGYLANKMSNIWYKYPLVSTNPCGEIWMSPNDCCCLGAVVLPRFVKGDKIDWAELRRTVHCGVRFLDDVLAVNNYPLPKIAQTCNELRRIGLGVMGLHDMLLLLGQRYDSPEGLEMVDRVMRFIKNESYEASVDLAIEKGAFPAFQAKEFLQSAFVKTLKPTTRKRIGEHGIRNCALNTIAPTGTTAIVQSVSSGIEPMYAPAYERRWGENGVPQTEVVVHPLLQQFVSEGRDASHFQGTYDISLRGHFEMQRICQLHTDNAVSKTINLKQGTSAEELSELYMEFLPELKGVTVYPDGSREDQPLTALSLESALAHVGAREGVPELQSCPGGVCEL